MLMMCWFYCIPFAKWLFFAFSLLLIIFSLFVLKRGIRQSRLKLRQAAFFLIFIAFLKIFTVDLYLLRDHILCNTDWFLFSCGTAGVRILTALGLAALALCSLFLFNAYRNFIRDRKQVDATPQQVNLRFWANLSIFLVLVLILWLAAPWVGYLTVGHVPQLFMQVPWQNLAILNIIALLVGFWKLEDCKWVYNPQEKTKKTHLTRVWTAKDTLWLSVILFLIVLAFSYASTDALSSRPSERGTHIQWDSIDFSFMGDRFHQPQ